MNSQYLHVRFRSAHLIQVINLYRKIGQNDNVVHEEHYVKNKKIFHVRNKLFYDRCSCGYFEFKRETVSRSFKIIGDFSRNNENDESLVDYTVKPV